MNLFIGLMPDKKINTNSYFRLALTNLHSEMYLKGMI